jgi:hypothetical protein
VWVEYGQVDVRDWHTFERVATLSAGETFAAPEDNRAIFLASPAHRSASVYYFSASGNGSVGTEPPDLTFTSSECGSGATQVLPVQLAATTTLFNQDRVGTTSITEDSVLYAGLLTIQPGAALGRTVTTINEPAYTSAGFGLIVPIFGGFGDGTSGQAGSAGPELPPGSVGWLNSGTQVLLENGGPVPVTALVFGVVASGTPILHGHHTGD